MFKNTRRTAWAVAWGATLYISRNETESKGHLPRLLLTLGGQKPGCQPGLRRRQRWGRNLPLWSEVGSDRSPSALHAVC